MLKLLLVVCFLVICNAKLPVVVNTWAFTDATKNGWNMLKASGDPITALEEGCRTCQTLQCDFTVGYGGSPDENGETTLDAVIFDGATMNMGAVGGIRKVKDAIGVARKVLEHTQHSILVGDLASNFAAQMGFHLEPLETDYSKELHKNWTENNCQPNFWMNVYPDSTKSCGPYSPPIETVCVKESVLTNEIGENCDNKFNRVNHDTIGMVVISESGHVVAGTSTNGANHKIPGRVGDSPLPGAGAYADGEVGAAVATGNGDIMMRFLPSFLAVERMRFGDSPEEAAKIAIARIAKRFPTFFGGVIAVDKSGSIGAACNGMEKFPFSVMNSTAQDPVINYVKCTNV